MLSRLLHLLVRAFQAVRRVLWFFTNPSTVGAHALPITPSGKIVLVTLSYARGWRLPGGGRKQEESGEEAVLRELREEIGMTAHESVEEVGSFRNRPDFRDDCSTLFVVRGVVYEPKWSLEVKAVAEFDLDALPSDTSKITRRLINAASATLA